MFISSACISYCGPFTGVYRVDMTHSWTTLITEREVPISEGFSVVKTLGNPLVLRDWIMNGLPSDSVSQDNSIYCKKGARWPLMIDPQF